MTEDQKNEIRKLAEDYEAKKRKWEDVFCPGGLFTHEEARQRNIESHVLACEKDEAWHKLERAKKAIYKER